MPLRTEAFYRGVAGAALERLGVREPPISVEALAASLGIPLRPVNLPEFFVAATVYEDGLPVMLVNWVKPEYERRRAIAHMLGHALLVLSGEGTSYPRDTGDHSEADLVANEIMMPGPLVVDQARLWFNDHRYLARLFGVEEAEMLDRMRNLGIIKGPEGIAWDY